MSAPFSLDYRRTAVFPDCRSGRQACSVPGRPSPVFEPRSPDFGLRSSNFRLKKLNT
jgi:hypothetical protein